MDFREHSLPIPRLLKLTLEELHVTENRLGRLDLPKASLGVFDEVSPRTFALTLAGSMLQRGRTSTTWALSITSPFHFRVYAEMLHAVRTGSRQPNSLGLTYPCLGSSSKASPAGAGVSDTCSSVAPR